MLFGTFTAQESSGKQGVLGPTKIYLAVQPSQPIVQSPQQQQQQNTTTITSQPPPLAPVQSPTQHQQVSIY